MKKSRIPGLLLVAGLLMALLFVGGCAVPTGEEPAEGGVGWEMIIFLILIFGVFYFLMIRPQRKRQKDQQQMTQELMRGDKVITIGGIMGQVESVSEDSVVIKVESGTTLRMLKSSIAGKRQNE